jgi:serine phosphatase RsbU (regulator of sigma subunit)
MSEELFPEQESELLAQLEERVVKALEAVGTLKRENQQLRKDIERLEAELSAQKSKSKQAASRISKLLEQMEIPSE